MSTQSTAIITGEQITHAVSTQVRNYIGQGELQLPLNYSAENALRSAMLALPDIKNMNKEPVLKACTQESIKGALLDMCIQGLNPAKKQCYFIAYGSKLVMQRSYFGEIAVAKAVNPNVEEIYPEVVFEGDKFDYVIKRGKIVEINHSQKIENKDKKIVAAYATIIYRDGSEESIVMTWDQIKKSWSKSQQAPIDANGNLNPKTTHGLYPEEMAKRTVVRKACKPIINNSNDSNLMVQYIKKSTDNNDAIEVDVEIEENANAIDIPAEFVEDEEPVVEEKEPF